MAILEHMSSFQPMGFKHIGIFNLWECSTWFHSTNEMQLKCTNEKSSWGQIESWYLIHGTSSSTNQNSSHGSRFSLDATRPLIQDPRDRKESTKGLVGGSIYEAWKIHLGHPLAINRRVDDQRKWHTFDTSRAIARAKLYQTSSILFILEI